MAHHVTNPYSMDDKASRAIDRKREQERRYMLQMLYKNADELATKLVQRLLDKHVIETTSDTAIRELFTDLFHKIPDMEEFEVQYKVAPLRGLVNNPNFISLFLTQYITEDLIDHSKIQDVFGDDLDIYTAVDSVMSAIRPN